MTMKPAFSNEAPFELSAYYPASRIGFAGVREAGFHTPSDRLLAIWLDGHVEFETSDGEVRRLPAGKAVLVEDTHGKGHIWRHREEGQNVITVILPSGLGAPLD
jgi:quercetin dioxygenase-like cupin family protein